MSRSVWPDQPWYVRTSRISEPAGNAGLRCRRRFSRTRQPGVAQQRPTHGPEVRRVEHVRRPRARDGQRLAQRLNVGRALVFDQRREQGHAQHLPLQVANAEGEKLMGFIAEPVSVQERAGSEAATGWQLAAHRFLAPQRALMPASGELRRAATEKFSISRLLPRRTHMKDPDRVADARYGGHAGPAVAGALRRIDGVHTHRIPARA